MSRSTTLLCRYVLMLAGIFSLSVAAHASTISYQQLSITSPVLAVAFDNDVTAAGIPAFPPNYFFSGEFCEDAYCSSPTGSSADSLLRLTNMTLTCNTGNGSACGAIDITFEALTAMIGSEETPESAVTVQLALQGTGQSSGFARICIADSSSFCASDLSGPQSFQFGFNQVIFGSASGAVVAPGGFDVYGVLHFNGLADGASVNLGNSLDLAINMIDTVPEPSTLAMMGVGLLFCGLVGKRWQSARVRSGR